MVSLLKNTDYNYLLNLLIAVDSDFYPSLSSRVNLEQYTSKLLEKGRVFGVYKENKLIGAVAIYMNDVDNKVSYCPFIAVLPDFRAQGISLLLIESAIAELKRQEFKKLSLTVRADSPASKLYKKVGFVIIKNFNYDKTDIQGYEMELTI
ncbi:GNAT family N-acetyltransferase [Pseudoalteromonas sp. AOP31-A2-14]|uniref:GNAT family N-acetyltransferase n=1 Tax=unclassified Pseudoalteromonas TaxID=194690 RepID=UPI003F99CF70